MSVDIKQNLKAIRQKINDICEKSGRLPDEITLVAVSKTKPDSDILIAFESGQSHFGENRAQELQEKMDRIKEEEIIWHFIGNLQTNKIKYMIDRVDWIQSVHKKKALKEIEKRASSIERNINVLIQVNISKEEQKSGCDPDELGKILSYAQDLKFTHVRGLMGMATFTDDADKVRSEFKLLKEIRDNHIGFEKGSVSLKELSMGMTNDMEIAIEEGATMLRIGSAIFGERNYG
ncbi:MAG: YggS family pyridoxal phosphate-dependent enzyme [Balneolaceae bacterium]